jgi:hypothetical protein
LCEPFKQFEGLISVENASQSLKRFLTTAPASQSELSDRKAFHEGGSLMEAEKGKGRRWRSSKSKRKREAASKRSEALRPQATNGHETAETEEIDKLLLSSLRYWEVTRDLIEERMGALRRRASSGRERRRAARFTEAEATS